MSREGAGGPLPGREDGGFGALLKRFRRAAGLTQEILAERAGYSTVYVSMLERGQRAPIPATVDVLSNALALDAHDRASLEAASRPDHPLAPNALIGRTREMELSAHMLAGSAAPVLLFSGEPGIGKTRLLDEVAARAAAGGTRVLRAGCQRRGGQQPYTPLLEAIQAHIASLGPEILADSLHGCAWLVRLLPELIPMAIEPLPDWELPADQERRLMDDAVVRFLARSAQPKGALLALDDLHWAGADALGLLTTLARNAGRAGLRIVGAYRDIEVHGLHPLSTALADMGHAGLVTHVALRPLEGDQSAQLLDRQLAGMPEVQPAVKRRLLQRADGVPFFLVSYGQGLRSGAIPDTGEDIPWDVTQAVRHRIASLPEPVPEVLAVTALAGRHLPLQVLSAVTGRTEDVVLEAMEEARLARLLEEGDDGTFVFTHEVIREVVDADLGAARRTTLHRRIGEVLERQEPAAPVEALVYHFARSGDREKAIVYLQRAGEAAESQHAHVTAEGYYREWIDRLDGLGRREGAAAARERLGRVLKTAGRYETALSTLEEAAGAYRVMGDLEGESRATAEIGRVHYLRGTTDDGIARLESLRDLLRLESRPAALATLDAALAPLYLLRGRYREQLEVAGEAARLAREIHELHILAEAEVWRGCAMNQLGELAEGRRVLEEAIPLAESVNDFVSLSHALNDVGFVSEVAGEFGRSRIFKERALRVAERVGDPTGITNMTFRLGQNAFLSGNWDLARSLFGRALSTARGTGESAIVAYPLFGVALLALAEGDLDAAAVHARECSEIAERSGDLQARRAAAALLAECSLLRGTPQEATRTLEAFDTGDEGLTLYPTLHVLAEAQLAAGKIEDAAEAAENSVARAESLHNRVALVDALRVRALTLVHLDRPAEAGADIDRAIALSREMHYPYGEGRALLAAAQILMKAQRAGPARDRLHEAARVFRCLGASLLAEHAEQGFTQTIKSG